MIQSIIFILVTIAVFVWAVRLYKAIFNKINLGLQEKISGHSGQRWRRVFLVAFGQKKMFKRLLPALFHLFIYIAFLLTQIELIEILIDGVTGRHRFFANKLGSFYTLVISVIEILSVLAFVATIVFLVRRNVLKVKRFTKPEMKGWPALDANLILFGEILLIIGIFMMNGSDLVLQGMDPGHYPETGEFLMSSFFIQDMFSNWSTNTLVVMERVGWWLHILVVYAFLLYLPISKHLHILFAFPNTYFAKIGPRGKMENMPAITSEIKDMLGIGDDSGTSSVEEEIPEFGAKDIFDFSWKNLLDAYTCTECGRCTAVCPANLTGKELSPRKIIMDIRDRTDEVYRRIQSKSKDFIPQDSKGKVSIPDKQHYDDGESLFDRISETEIWACTTCNACVEECPVLIDPLEPILKLRRYKILTESSGPSDWIPMFNSLENSGAVWQVNEERDAWIKN